MSILRKLAKAKAQGYIRTAELLFLRVVPPWIFRFSMGNIYDFDIDALRSLADDLEPKQKEALVTKCATETDERMKLRTFTWNTVLLDTTANDLGFTVCEKTAPDKLLGGVWAGVGSFLEDSLAIEFQFADDQAWLYCAFVDGDARGKGVYKRLVSFAADEVKQRGFKRLLGIVQPWNKISRRMHEQHSLGTCGRIGALRIFGIVWVFYSGNISVDKTFVTRIKSNPARVVIH